MKTYNHDESALILEAINSVLLGNNGYADIGNNPVVIEGVRTAGFTVIRGTNLHGRPTHKGFTAQGVASQREYLASLPRKPIKLPSMHEEFDYEGAILARQEKYILY